MNFPTLAPFLWHPWSTARLRRYRGVADRVVCLSAELSSLSDGELTASAQRIGWEARTGVPLQRLLPEAFALVREASRRVLGKAHFPVQLMGGIAMFEGRITEMQTGEGKTLTAALPTFLHALSGLGCHVITTNDYLARRDVAFLGPVYTQLGLTVGCVDAESSPEQRRAAYAKDITYSTAQELGFDFLRDRLEQPPGQLSLDDAPDPFSGSTTKVQRGHHFVLIDEADSILIDEARTPLIIGLQQPNDPATIQLFRWCRRTIQGLQRGEDYTYEPEHRRRRLTCDLPSR